MTSASGNMDPGPIAASTAVIAAIAPHARFDASTTCVVRADLLSRADLVSNEHVNDAKKRQAAVNATARPELRNHAAFALPGANTPCHPATSTACAAANAAAPVSSAVTRNTRPPR